MIVSESKMIEIYGGFLTKFRNTSTGLALSE